MLENKRYILSLSEELIFKRLFKDNFIDIAETSESSFFRQLEFVLGGILIKSLQDIDSIEREAYQEGYDDGFSDGSNF